MTSYSSTTYLECIYAVSVRQQARGHLLGHLGYIAVAKAAYHPWFSAKTVIPKGNFDHVASRHLVPIVGIGLLEEGSHVREVLSLVESQRVSTVVAEHLAVSHGGIKDDQAVGLKTTSLQKHDFRGGKAGRVGQYT